MRRTRRSSRPIRSSSRPSEQPSAAAVSLCPSRFARLAGGEVRLEEAVDLAARDTTFEAAEHAFPIDEDEGGDACDVQTLGEIRTCVDVDLHDLEAPFLVDVHPGDEPGHPPRRARPTAREEEQQWAVVRHVGDIGHTHGFPPCTVPKRVSGGRPGGYDNEVEPAAPDSLARRLEPDDVPDWQAETDSFATPTELGRAFERDTTFTVGVEEELMLLDPVTWALTPAVDVALDRADGDPRFTREIRQSQIEIVTPVAGNAQALGVALAGARVDLHRHLGGAAVIAAAGTHPWFEDWGELAEGERYRRIADEYPWATAGNIPCGLHIHVAVPGAERALAIYNAVRAYLPELSALSANSPYLAGADTGLASARRTLNDAFHRSGIPPAFPHWPAFAHFVRWGQIGGVFPDAKHLWWDLRPHASFGTLELRVADAQTRVEDTIALVAIFQSLVATLSEQLDREGALAVHATERIEENAYRAIRYGVKGWMVDLVSGATETTRERITRLLDRIEPSAAKLGNATAILHARALLADNGAERQRYVVERLPAGDDLRGLTRWLAHETLASAEEVLDRHV